MSTTYQTVTRTPASATRVGAHVTRTAVDSRSMGAAIASLLLAAACGGSTGDDRDAGAEDGDGGATVAIAPPVPPIPPEPPLPPAPPQIAPCPEGWREVEAVGVTVCDPWPATGRRRDCADHEAHFPGEPDCARIGTECPADGWPRDLPTGASVTHVSATAAPGGNGTRALPFDTLEAAIAAAPASGIIAIAPGEYTGTFSLRRAVTLWGACAERTILRPTIGSDAVIDTWARAELRNLRIDGTGTAGGIRASAETTLTEVVIEHAASWGVFISGSVGVTLDHALIRHARPPPGAPDGAGFGIVVSPRARLDAHRLAVRDVLGIGIASQGTTTATGVVVSEVACLSPEWTSGGVGTFGGRTAVAELATADTCGTAIVADEGELSVEAFHLGRVHLPAPADYQAIAAKFAGRVTARRGWISNQRETGIAAAYASAPGATPMLILEDVVSEHVGDAPAATSASYVAVVGHLEARRIADSRSVGYAFWSPETAMMVVEDATVTALRAVDLPSTAIVAGPGATQLTAVRVRVEESDGGGILAGGSAHAEVSDLDVRRARAVLAKTMDGTLVIDAHGGLIAMFDGGDLSLTRGRLSDSDGYGVFLRGGHARLADITLERTRYYGLFHDGGSDVELARVIVNGYRGAGLSVHQPGTRVIAEDLVIRDSHDTDFTGEGISVSRGASLDLTRAVVDGARNVGLNVYGRDDVVMVRATDLAVLHTRTWEELGLNGRGIAVQGDAVAAITRATIDDSHEIGVGIHENGQLLLEDATISVVHANACSGDGCPGSGGHGLGVYGGALTASRVDVRGAAGCAFHVDSPMSLDLAGVSVAASEFGVCGEDLSLVIGRVAVADDNETGVAMMSFYIPPPPSL